MAAVIEWVYFAGSDVCVADLNGLSVIDPLNVSLRWRIHDQYGQADDFQQDSRWNHPPPFCSNDKILAIANWKGVRLIDRRTGRTTKILAIPNGQKVTAMSIAADSSTLTAAISPTGAQIGGGSVLYHWDLKKTGYIATNVPTADTGN